MSRESVSKEKWEVFCFGILLGEWITLLLLSLYGWGHAKPVASPALIPSDYIRVLDDWNRPHLWLA